MPTSMDENGLAINSLKSERYVWYGCSGPRSVDDSGEVRGIEHFVCVGWVGY